MSLMSSYADIQQDGDIVDDDSKSEDDDDDEYDANLENRIQGLFPNPLEIIDPDADLNAVLAAKSVGDALQILCPTMTGIPSKSRGKYQKRRFLSKADKERMMRLQNRENAKRTRIRRKIFSHFLTLSLSALEAILYPKRTNPRSFGAQEDKTGRNLDKLELNARSIVTNNASSAFPPRIKGSSNFPTSTQMSADRKEDIRLENCRKYLALWGGTRFPDEIINSFSHPNLTNVQTFPQYRQPPFANDDPPPEFLEARGRDALLAESKSLAKFFSTVIFPKRHFKFDVEIRPELVSYNQTDNSVFFPGTVHWLDGGPKTANSNPDISSYKIASSIPIFCDAQFADDFRVVYFRAVYSVEEVKKRMTRVASSIRMSFPADVALTRCIADIRVASLKKFIVMRYSNRPYSENWLSVCSTSVLHVSPLPALRERCESAVVRDQYYELHGIVAIIDDTRARHKFLAELVSSSGADPKSLMIDLNMHTTNVIMSSSGHRLLVPFDLLVYATSEASMRQSMLAGPSLSPWLLIAKVTVSCELIFTPDDRISILHERYNEMDFTLGMSRSRPWMAPNHPLLGGSTGGYVGSGGGSGGGSMTIGNGYGGSMNHYGVTEGVRRVSLSDQNSSASSSVVRYGGGEGSGLGAGIGTGTGAGAGSVPPTGYLTSLYSAASQPKATHRYHVAPTPPVAVPGPVPLLPPLVSPSSHPMRADGGAMGMGMGTGMGMGSSQFDFMSYAPLLQLKPTVTSRDPRGDPQAFDGGVGDASSFPGRSGSIASAKQSPQNQLEGDHSNMPFPFQYSLPSSCLSTQLSRLQN